MGEPKLLLFAKETALTAKAVPGAAKATFVIDNAVELLPKGMNPQLPLTFSSSWSVNSIIAGICGLSCLFVTPLICMVLSSNLTCGYPCVYAWGTSRSSERKQVFLSRGWIGRDKSLSLRSDPVPLGRERFWRERSNPHCLRR